MKSPLNILHLEDNPNDAALVQSALDAGGITCTTTCVQNREDFVAAIKLGGIDLILSDYSLPTFDGLAAGEIVRTQCPDVPFILVSGTLGEELAIDSLKNGATDYVLKERLARLAPAVRRAMQEVETRNEGRRMQAQFIEAQKMEVIGHLASGVAHDFNNILAVITGYSHLLMDELTPDDPLRKHVGEIQHAAERAVGLTRQLLVFSRKQTVQPVVLDLNEEVQNMDRMLRRLVDENIAMKFVPEEHIGRIKADPGHIGQVLMNLVVNARDAMPKGGEITITTNNIKIATAEARTCPDMPPGDYVKLSVNDSGTGMTEEVKARLFEAFFTTKPKGKGTGLGLATCQTIVQQSSGYIGVQSEMGRGTTFEIYFPRVEQALDASSQTAQHGPMPRGTETLLVVEDEPSVRHLARGILQTLGYEVLSASNGQEALRVAQPHKGAPIKLVITDVVMPVMGGKVMAEWLKAIYPDLKILFTSGYTDDAIAHHGVLESGVAFLPKPYTPAILARKVRAMLDNQSDSVFLARQSLSTGPPALSPK